MNSTYVRGFSAIQKTADSNAASILDTSSQNEFLQRKADLASCSAQYSRISENNQKRNVVQCMGQDKIESQMGDLFGIYDAIKAYGGLCGGWSLLMLEDPEKASEIWESFERYAWKKKSVGAAQVETLKKVFKHVVDNQLRLLHADKRDSALSEQDDEAVKSLEDFVSIHGKYDDSRYIAFVSDCDEIFYFVRKRQKIKEESTNEEKDEDYPDKNEIDEKKKIFIKDHVLNRVFSGKWLLSTNNHYMSISFNERPQKNCLGFVAETNQTGINPFKSMDHLLDILIKDDTWFDLDKWCNEDVFSFKCYAKKICESVSSERPKDVRPEKRKKTC